MSQADRLTERVMLDALWGRLQQTARGTMSPRHVMAEQVRYSPAGGYTIADAISIDTWGSGHYSLHGYEVKVSRSDLLRELKAPGKSLPWRQHCRYWWLVTPHGLIRPGDDLHGWGLLTLQGRWLRKVHAPTLNTDPLPLTPMAQAGLMRATAQTARHHSLTFAERLILERDPDRATAVRWGT